MSRVVVNVDASTLRQGRVGPATGNIFLSLGSFAFPSKEWNDFVVVILEAWVNALLRLLGGASMHESVYFMDGPFAVDLVLLTRDTLRLRAIKNACDEVACVEVDVLPLAVSLLSGSDSVLAVCRNQSCWSVDAEKLSTSLSTLRKEIERRYRGHGTMPL